MDAVFTLDPAPTFRADARITVPGQDAPALLCVVWRHKGRAALRRWLDALGSDESADALMEVIAGWDAVVDGDGQPLPFGRSALERLLDAYPASGPELCRAYLAALTESRLGN